MQRVIGSWSIAGGVSLSILEIEHGIVEYATVQYYNEKPKRVKIHYTSKDRAFINFARVRYYLDECVGVAQ
jgi:hypothetical protein